MTEEQLTMTFDPYTIEHLGVRLYSTLPPVMSELIANAYDADAGWVRIKLVDCDDEKKIIVEDNGDGMTYEEIDGKFLRIGRNRRADDGDKPTAKGRKVIGKKGLGKLSFFGIAHVIEIATRRDGKENVFAMKWEDIKQSDKNYHPTIVKKDEDYPEDEHGTTITLSEIQRVSDFSPDQLASSLSKIFIIDDDFKIIIQHNDGDPITIDNERKFSELDKEVEWRIPDDSQFKTDYERKDEITGYLMTTRMPIPPRTNMRGIVLFSRRKLVNLPEYFSDSTSSHFFSYLTGWLEVDFIDEIEDDVIATNRQSLNWDHPEIQKLRSYLRGLLRWLQSDWRDKRAEVRGKRLVKATGIQIDNWFDKLPEDVRKHIEPVVRTIIQKSELPTKEHQQIVKSFHELVPEYPYFHWRHLHPEIQEASGKDYRKNDYYRAFLEAAKRYINAVRDKSESTNSSESSMMGEVFGDNNCKIQVAQNYKKPDGDDFQDATIRNIESGQKFLSMGVVSGCRNPVSHEEIQDLRESGLFTEKDCLDALSLLSHLFNRLDNSVKTTT